MRTAQALARATLVKSKDVYSANLLAKDPTNVAELSSQMQKSKYNQRTISGIDENKKQPTTMNKTALRELIKEELYKSINEQPQQITVASEIAILKKYLEGAGKSYVGKIDTPVDLKNILTLIWNGMDDKLKNNSNSVVTYLKKSIDTKISKTLTTEPSTPKA